MLIIDKKIVIAHMKKCGGTSVCTGLIESLEPSRLDYFGYTEQGEKRSARSRRNNRLWKHSSAADIVDALPLRREELTVYLVSVRPLWERVASFYFHATRYNEMRGLYTWVEGMSFQAFLRSEYLAEVERLDEFCANGAVDFFVDYANLSDWYSAFAKSLGARDTVLPSYNVGSASGKVDYKALYTDGDIEFMSQYFAGEIRMLDRMQRVDGGLFRETTAEIR